MLNHSIPAIMRAACAFTWGGPENIRIETIPVPKPGSGQVLVKVLAVGLNAADKHLLLGTPRIVRLAEGLRRRKRPVLGTDIAGIVVAVGDGCTRLAVGDAVFGLAAGGIAEYGLAQEKRLCHKPEALTWEQAAAIPISGCTALQALERAGVKRGDHLLINGASGGVGTAAVQLARARGAIVIATCSAANRDLVASLGAETVHDYRTQDALDSSQPYDAILDIAGTLPNRRAVRTLVPGGIMMKVGAPKGDWVGPLPMFLTRYITNLGVPGTMNLFMAVTTLEDLQRLAQFATDGLYLPPIEQVYSLEQTPQAYTRLVSGRTAGKSVIRIGSDV